MTGFTKNVPSFPGVYIPHLDMGEGTLFPPTPQYFTEVSHPTGVHIYGGTPQGYKGDLTH